MSKAAPIRAGEDHEEVITENRTSQSNGSGFDVGGVGGGSLHAEGTIPKWEDPIYPNSRTIKLQTVFKCKIQSLGKYDGKAFQIPWEYPTLCIPAEQLYRQIGPQVIAMKFLGAHCRIKNVRNHAMYSLGSEGEKIPVEFDAVRLAYYNQKMLDPRQVPFTDPDEYVNWMKCIAQDSEDEITKNLPQAKLMRSCASAAPGNKYWTTRLKSILKPNDPGWIEKHMDSDMFEFHHTPSGTNPWRSNEEFWRTPVTEIAVNDTDFTYQQWVGFPTADVRTGHFCSTHNMFPFTSRLYTKDGDLATRTYENVLYDMRRANDPSNNLEKHDGFALTRMLDTGVFAQGYPLNTDDKYSLDLVDSQTTNKEVKKFWASLDVIEGNDQKVNKDPFNLYNQQNTYKEYVCNYPYQCMKPIYIKPGRFMNTGNSIQNYDVYMDIEIEYDFAVAESAQSYERTWNYSKDRGIVQDAVAPYPDQQPIYGDNKYNITTSQFSTSKPRSYVNQYWLQKHFYLKPREIDNVTYKNDQGKNTDHTHQFHNIIQKWFVNDVYKIPMKVPNPPLITAVSNIEHMARYGTPMIEEDMPNPKKLAEVNESKKRKLVA